MPEDLDPNKLIVEFLNTNLGWISQSVSSGLKESKNLVKSKFRNTYSGYLGRILERCSRSKSFFVRSEALPIYDFFVPPDLSNRHRRLTSPGASELATVAPMSIITGSGGCGKTMLMRHLLISCLQDSQKTPVLIELRQLNDDGGSLKDSVLENLRLNGLDVGQDYLGLALQNGHFCFLLDGFDELRFSIRESVLNETQRLALSYPDNWFFLASRPDAKLDALPDFSQFSVDPLDLERAVELVRKLPFENPVKERFVSALEDGLYEQHESFLSNPLLLSIMLLTFGDIAHIPDKLSIFYNQAFESLFQKHDALKGGFQRDRRTKLDIQDFARAFSAFCVQSYDQRQFSFSHSNALAYFDKAKDISGLEFESEGLLQDAIQAVCLMIEDGLEISFAHRSFQEFFVAKFISAAPPDTKGQLVKRFSNSGQADSVLQLLFEIDPFAVEKHYLLPAIDRVKSLVQYKRRVGVTHFLRYLKLMFGMCQGK